MFLISDISDKLCIAQLGFVENFQFQTSYLLRLLFTATLDEDCLFWEFAHVWWTELRLKLEIFRNDFFSMKLVLIFAPYQFYEWKFVWIHDVFTHRQRFSLELRFLALVRGVLVREDDQCSMLKLESHTWRVIFSNKTTRLNWVCCWWSTADSAPFARYQIASWLLEVWSVKKCALHYSKYSESCSIWSVKNTTTTAWIIFTQLWE